MDTFDRVFCWTLTVAVVGAGCYFVLTATSLLQSVAVGVVCTVCVNYIWTHIRKESGRIIAERERDLFVAAAVRYFRLAEDSDTGLTGVSYPERDLAMMAFARYRTQVLEQSPRRSPR